MQTRVVCLVALLLFSLSWVEASPPSASSDGEDNGKPTEGSPAPDSGAPGDLGQPVDEGTETPDAPEGQASSGNPEIPSFSSVLDFSGWHYHEPATDERTEPANDHFKIQPGEDATNSLDRELTVDVAKYDSSKPSDGEATEEQGVGETGSGKEHSPGGKSDTGSPESETGNDSSPEHSDKTEEGKEAKENPDVKGAKGENSKETQGAKEGEQQKDSTGDWSVQEESVTKSDKKKSDKDQHTSKDMGATKRGEEQEWGEPSMDIVKKEDSATQVTTEKEGGEGSKEKSSSGNTEWESGEGAKDKSSSKGGEHSTGGDHAGETTYSDAVQSEPDGVGARFSNFFSRLSGGSTHSVDHGPRRASIESANMGKKSRESGNSGIRHSSLDQSGSNQAHHGGTGHGGSSDGPIFSIPNRASSGDANSFRRSRINGLYP